jgi:pSer/pThr/pTyr-binding forkhead associated (FHA) protein
LRSAILNGQKVAQSLPIEHMKTPPVIVVQLVHIEGPLKGQIQEFSDSVIAIGRHPSSHVQFPKDLTAISRTHAEIVREGNRFKLTDRSTNGTFVNGKRVQEIYLKDGDVLTFAEGGPKVSFLTNVAEEKPEAERVQRQEPSLAEQASPGRLQTPVPPSAPARRISEAVPPPMAKQPPPLQRVHGLPSAVSQGAAIQKVQIPLIIQYGPRLQSFKELPVTVGRSPACEFVLEHPAILDRHAQFFFQAERYWVKDLTGKNLVSINGAPIQSQSAVNPDDTLALSSDGPRFRFLGGGRLAEIEVSAPEPPAKIEEAKAKASGDQPGDKGLKGAKAIFHKFLRR